MKRDAAHRRWVELETVLPATAAQAWAAVANATRVTDGDGPGTWRPLPSALDLADAQAGQHRRAGSGAPPLSGSMKCIAQDRSSRFVLLHLDAPCTGAALIGGRAADGGMRCPVSLHPYGEQAARVAGSEQPRWQAWLQSLLPQAPGAPATPAG